MLEKAFSYNGRIGRPEYIISFLIYLILTYIINLIVVSYKQYILFPGIPLFFINVWFFSAQAAKRCHDKGFSGWYQLIPFFNLWLIFANSDEEENEYGPNPNETGNEEG